MKNFEKYFESKLILKDCFIGRFCGEERVSVYSIKNFKIGDLIFNDFEIFVPTEPRLKFPFLLNATLFLEWSILLTQLTEILL